MANIADFNSLIAQSQSDNVPIFALRDDLIDQIGVILDNMKESRDNFRKVFSSLATDVHALIEIV